MSETVWLIIGIVSGLVSIGVAVALYVWVNKQDAGSPQAQKVAGRAPSPTLRSSTPR